MWNPRTMQSTVMSRLVCAMAVSTGVWSFPMSPSKKNYPQPTPCRDPFTSRHGGAGWSRWQDELFHSNQHHTRCEAAIQPSGILEEESFYEKMALPARGLEGHAIFGVLLGENMIERYDIYKRPEGSDNENIIVAHVKLGSRIDGHKGVVHGGILSLLFDDALGFGFDALGVKMAFTANLTVDYRAPVPAGTMIRLQAQLAHREGRKIFWKAQMTSMDGETLYAECSSLYIIPRSNAK